MMQANNRKETPLVYDPLIIPRVKEYLEENIHQTYVDVTVMARKLQERYKEYNRRKAGPFRMLVRQAYKLVLQSYGLGSNPSSDDNLEENSDLELMNEDDSSNNIGSMISNLYTKKTGDKPEPESIDISSDESDENTLNVSMEKRKSAGEQYIDPAKSIEKIVTIGEGSAEKILSPPTKKRRVDPLQSASGTDRSRAIQLTPSKGSIDLNQPQRPSMPSGTGLRQRRFKIEVHKKESKYTFHDVGGSVNVLIELCELIFHMKRPGIYTELGASPPRGFLIHGPPGVGKSFLAHAIAGQLNIGIMEVAATELIGGVSGESEERIREVFQQALSMTPCVLFIDEVDAISSNRLNAQKDMERRVVSQLISSFDSLKNQATSDQLLIIGATSRPDMLDPALRRVGRFEHEISLKVPSRKERVDILSKITKNLSIEENFNFDKVAELTAGFVGGDLSALATRAASIAVKREYLSQLENSRNEEAMETCSGTNSSEQTENIEPRSTGSAGQKEPSSRVNTLMDEEQEEIGSAANVLMSEQQEEIGGAEDALMGEEQEEIGSAEIALGNEELEEKESSNGLSMDEKTGTSYDQVSSSATMDTEGIDNRGVPASRVIPSKIPIRGSGIQTTAAIEVQRTIKDEIPIPPPCTTEDQGSIPAPGITPSADSISDLDTAKSLDRKPVPITPPVSDTSRIEDRLRLEGKSESVKNPVLDEKIAAAEKKALDTLEHLIEWLNSDPKPPEENKPRKLTITLDDFLTAIKFVKPTAQREGFITVPNVTWNDIGSLGHVKEELQLAVLAPIRYPQVLEALGIDAPAGILLSGPPGCGKTLLAKAVANEAGVNFISVKGPELMNMYVGESERAVRQCFQRARDSAPCVIFFDEFDSLCPKRCDSKEGGQNIRVINQLLTEMDGVEGRKGVFVLAATNRPDIIDPAMLRPGRLDTIIYVGVPKESDRVEIFNAITKDGHQPPLADDITTQELAKLTDGFTGADIAGVLRKASVYALREYITTKYKENKTIKVTKAHMLMALQRSRPSISPADREIYDKLGETLTPDCQF